MSCAGAYLALLLSIARADTRHLRLFGWNLQLEENTAIHAPDFKECNYYKGHVVGAVSSAMLTECAGEWYGLLQVGEEIFMLPPLKDNNNTEHAMRKRDLLLALMPQKPPMYNLSRDMDHEAVDFEDELPLKAPIRTRSSQATHEDFYRKEPLEFQTKSRLWLEIVIVADSTMIKFHNDKLQPYILAQMNIVTAIFNDISLDANLSIIINKLYLEREWSLKHTELGISEYLKRVNKWNRRHLLKIPTEHRWDALVWLTRTDLNGPSGLSTLNGVCSLNSASLVRDEGFTSAFVIAHELGHLLGLQHDESCEQPASTPNTVMNVVVRAALKFSWSWCSMNQFHLKSNRWKCIHNRSGSDGLELGRSFKPAHVFSLDHQCRVEFGDGFSLCKETMDASICSVLYCAHDSNPSACVSKNAPPLEGTVCKKDHYCSNGECTPHHEKDQWGPWVHETCRAECGYGVRVKTRCRIKDTSCRFPSVKVTPCWTGERCTRDVRAELCARQPHHLPHLEDDLSKRCQLRCVNLLNGEVTSSGSMPDGTSCSYERPYDVCYKGICLKGHCNASDAGCNWCPNGQCRNSTYMSTHQLQKGWSKLLEIPQEVHKFTVYISLPASVEVGIKPHKSPKVFNIHRYFRRQKERSDSYNYFKYDVNIPQSLRIVELGDRVTEFNELERVQGRLVVAGTVVKYKQTDSVIVISADSQPLSSISILVTPGNTYAVGAQLSFTLNISVPYSTNIAHRPIENRRSVRRGPCSVSCGGGTRLVKQRCLRGQTCKTHLIEACNLHRCEFTWMLGDWEPCSQTCGTEGVQERQVYCVPQEFRLTTRAELIRNSVSPYLCTSQKKPATEQPCNRIPCPVYWQEMDWTECSQSCGLGEQYRYWRCPAEDSLCGPRPAPRRRRCRRRRCPPPSTPQPPENNRIQNCDLIMPELMKGYCKVPYFRKQCARTCREIADTT